MERTTTVLYQKADSLTRAYSRFLRVLQFLPLDNINHPCRWTEPLILCLIILTACVLISQASHSVLLPSDQSMPTSLRSLFFAWEDYVLFGLFTLYTSEAIAPICVSGFLLDPEVPILVFFVSSTSSITSTSR
ncbi:uncharacterized protein F5891DRAFT_701616 [Suillus fuscotomentosus]|uniref:Uncharacterized protein n=1 Tax=Suillus fuscotomentosus TaxID=1912939 RepID=A0AAD4DWG3_9AGAM|nr:uncharacterized protein F5891DRAFT_701616 [Suillus fuscotomentosus]KAG1894796.1 hypothetical protein F5891DRAFT_701616 [Suillus fuscotomentosus]